MKYWMVSLVTTIVWLSHTCVALRAALFPDESPWTLNLMEDLKLPDGAYVKAPGVSQWFDIDYGIEITDNNLTTALNGMVEFFLRSATSNVGKFFDGWARKNVVKKQKTKIEFQSFFGRDPSNISITEVVPNVLLKAHMLERNGEVVNLELDNSYKRDVSVVVDPYSSGSLLVEELNKQKIPIVGVLSSLSAPDFVIKSFQPEWRFIDVHIHATGDETNSNAALQTTADYLTSHYNVISVMPGTETGVELSDYLGRELEVAQRNNASTSCCRRDKKLMQEQIAKKGLRSVKQFSSSNYEKALEWHQKELNGQWPVVVKPINSAGSEGVSWCHSKEEVMQAFARDLDKVNVLGEENNELLIQEFLTGHEYVVDAISCDGEHLVCSIIKYAKLKDADTQSITYDHLRLLDREGPEQAKLVPYVIKVLDALDIENGASHTEVFLTDNGDACLVETGARMNGCHTPARLAQVTDLRMPELLVDACHFSGKKNFKRLVKKKHEYVKKKHLYEVALCNHDAEGILGVDLDLDQRISSLASATEFQVYARKGDFLPLTRNLLQSPGRVMMMSEEEDQILADIAMIRGLEATGEMYVFAED